MIYVLVQEIAKSKKEREKVREVTKLLNNPEEIEQEVPILSSLTNH
jgi:hypothetical protein